MRDADFPEWGICDGWLEVSSGPGVVSRKNKDRLSLPYSAGKR